VPEIHRKNHALRNSFGASIYLTPSGQQIGFLLIYRTIAIASRACMTSGCKQCSLLPDFCG